MAGGHGHSMRLPFVGSAAVDVLETMLAAASARQSKYADIHDVNNVRHGTAVDHCHDTWRPDDMACGWRMSRAACRCAEAVASEVAPPERWLAMHDTAVWLQRAKVVEAAFKASAVQQGA